MTSTTDGVNFSPVPGVETLLPETGVNGINGASPDIAYSPLDGRWYAVLSTSGFEVFADGTTNSLVQVPAPGLHAGWNRIILEVDSVDNNVSAWCNGVRILDRFDLGTLNGGAGFLPNIQHAVFNMFRPDADISRIDDFATSQTRYVFLGDFETGNLSTWDEVCVSCAQ